MVNQNIKPVLVILVLLTITAMNTAAAEVVGRQNVGISITVNHGTVIEVEQVKLQSAAAGGATLGGIAGLASARHKSGKNKAAAALTGALLGGVLTKVMEGSNKANAYTVKMENGSTVKVVSEQKGIRVKDCVAVESGKSTNIHKVSSALCEKRDPHPMVDLELQQKHHEDASDCIVTKEQLLHAKTEQEANAIAVKVRVFCGH
jgi:hypothetical protein